MVGRLGKNRRSSSASLKAIQAGIGSGSSSALTARLVPTPSSMGAAWLPLPSASRLGTRRRSWYKRTPASAGPMDLRASFATASTVASHSKCAALAAAIEMVWTFCPGASDGTNRVASFRRVATEVAFETSVLTRAAGGRGLATGVSSVSCRRLNFPLLAVMCSTRS